MLTAVLLSTSGQCAFCRHNLEHFKIQWTHWQCIECPTRYRTRHFFNNSNTNEDIATKFEQEYVRCVRNEEECVCSRCNILISGKIIKKMPGSVASGTHCTTTSFTRHSLSAVCPQIQRIKPSAPVRTYDVTDVCSVLNSRNQGAQRTTILLQSQAERPSRIRNWAWY